MGLKTKLKIWEVKWKPPTTFSHKPAFKKKKLKQRTVAIKKVKRWQRFSIATKLYDLTFDSIIKIFFGLFMIWEAYTLLAPTPLFQNCKY